MNKIARYVVAGSMLASGVAGLSMTNPVEGIGAPMPEKASASKGRAVRDVTVNLGGKRTRVIVKMDRKSESVTVRRTKGKTPGKLPACTEDYDMSGRKYGCRGIDYLGHVGGRDLVLDYVVVPLPDKRLAVVAWSDGTGEIIFR